MVVVVVVVVVDVLVEALDDLGGGVAEYTGFAETATAFSINMSVTTSWL